MNENELYHVRKTNFVIRDDKKKRSKSLDSDEMRQREKIRKRVEKINKFLDSLDLHIIEPGNHKTKTLIPKFWKNPYEEDGTPKKSFTLQPIKIEMIRKGKSQNSC